MRRLLTVVAVLLVVCSAPCWAVSLRSAQEAVQKAFPQADPLLRTYFAYVLVSLPEGESIGFTFQGARATFGVQDGQLWVDLESGGGQVNLPLTPGEGTTVGDWVLWRVESDSLLITHPGSGSAVEVIADSNGWIRWARGNRQLVIFTPTSWEDQRMETDYRAFLGRKNPGVALPEGTYEFGDWTLRCLPGRLELQNHRYNDVVTVREGSDECEYRDEDGVTLSIPGGLEDNRGARVPSSEEDTAATEAFGIAVGQGARFGAWAIYPLEDDMVLFVNPEGKVAFEIWTRSNGWFRCTDGEHQWVVWSVAETSAWPMDTDFATYLGLEVPRQELEPGEFTCNSYTMTVTADKLDLVNSTNDETITLWPDQSEFRFRGIDGKTLVLPTGAGGG